MSIPFANADTINTKNLNTEKRLSECAKFMGEIKHPSLDIGESNYIGRSLGIQENTEESDFNQWVSTKRITYATITCFEVIEHIMNPAFFLGQLRLSLTQDSVLYLSTPVAAPFGILWHQCDYHFTEYKEKQLRILFDYCGFKVVKSKIFDPFPWWFHFTGLRPFLRWFTQRTIIFELVRA
jgi:2-polyprenyl-3-methyl-5-hydroxy-6-metoxy-1,4-benzoquinol methylase